MRRLLFLNGLAAFSIATYHASAFGFSALFEWTDRYLPVTVPNYDQIGSPAYYALLFIRHLDGFAIPAFIFVSGFFLAFMARGNEKRLSWKLVFSRVKAFVPPFVLWTFFRFVILKDLPDSINEVFSPYYYIVLITQFYLLSPFLISFGKISWKWLLLAGAILEISSDGLFLLNDLGISSPLLDQIRILLPLWAFPRRIFWFVLGIAAGLNLTSFFGWIERNRKTLAIVSVILLALSLLEYQFFANLVGEQWLGPSFRGPASRIYGLTSILALMSFDFKGAPLYEQISWLGDRSFGIYMANIPSIYPIAIIMHHYFPWMLGNQLVYQLVLITAGLGIPLLLMGLMRASPARGYYKYVFG